MPNTIRKRVDCWGQADQAAQDQRGLPASPHKNLFLYGYEPSDNSDSSKQAHE